MPPIRISIKTLPISVNHMYQRARGRVIKTSLARATAEAIGWEMRAGYTGKPFTGPIAVNMTITWPDKRRRDLDNAMKQMGDAGNGILWKDDSQIVEWHLFKKTGPKAGIEMIITP